MRIRIGGTIRVGLAAAMVILGMTLGAFAADEAVDAATKKLMGAGGLFQRELYEMAAQEYDEFLTAYPNHAQAPSARYGRAVSRYKLNQYDKAAAELTELVANRSFEQRDEALAVLSQSHQALKQYDKALADIDDHLKSYPESKHAGAMSLSRAQVLYLLNRRDASAEAAQAYITKYPDSADLPSAYYFLALSQHGQGKHDDAIKTLGTMLEKFPDSPRMMDAVLLLGQAYETQDKRSDAAEQYRKLIAASGKVTSAQGLYTLGVALHKVRDFDSAIAQLSAVLDKHGGSDQAAPARFQLGLSQLAAGKTAEARVTFNSVAEKDKSRNAIARYWHAQTDIADKHFDAARTTLDALAALDPPPENLEAVLFDRAACLMSLEKFEPAAEQFAALAEKYPQSPQRPEMLYRQAFCLHRMKTYDKSLELCDKLRAMPESSVTESVMELTAENHFLTKKYDAAADVLGQLINRVPDARKGKYVLRLGQCAYFKGDYPRAAKLLAELKTEDEAVKRDAAFLLGDAQLQTGDFKGAQQSLTGYLDMGKGDQAEARFKLAVAQIRGNALDDAQKTLKQVMTGDTGSPWTRRAMFEYGQIAYQQKRYDEAVDALGKALSLSQEPELKASSTYLLAWIDFDTKKFDRAAAGFQRVVDEHPEHALAPESAFQRAVAMREAGKTKQALELFQAFVKTYPDSSNTAGSRYLIAACMAELGQNEEAAALLKSLSEENRADGDAVLYDLAWTYRALKNDDSAMASYRSLLQKFPKSTRAPAARTELAEMLYMGEKYDEAAKLLEDVSAVADLDPATWATAQYRLGWCYTKLNQPQRSAVVFQVFAYKQPEHELAPSALFQSGAALVAAEKRDEATRLFEEVRSKYPKHELAAASLLKLGELAAIDQKYEDSLKLYEQYLANHGNDKFAYLAQFGMGWAQENLGKPEDARKSYGQVIANHNGPTAARAQFQIGETYFTQKNFAAAAKELVKVDIVYAYPQWAAPALLEAGRAFEQLGDNAKARQQYEQCVKRFSDQPEAKLAAERMAKLGG